MKLDKKSLVIQLAEYFNLSFKDLPDTLKILVKSYSSIMNWDNLTTSERILEVNKIDQNDELLTLTLAKLATITNEVQDYIDECIRDANKKDKDSVSLVLERLKAKFDFDYLEQLMTEFESTTTISNKKNHDHPITKPLSEIERVSLLVIIAALAKEAKCEINKISKAGEVIANLTQIIGSPVSATTIERHIKLIPYALEKRAK